MASEKICTKCGATKPLDEFYRKGAPKSGFRARCIRCVKDYYQDNRKRIRQRDVKRMYGISLADYDRMLEEQGGVCAICGKSPEENGMRLSVDHDHNTEEIRSLLCHTCNFGIGSFGDDLQLLENAKLYLESFGEVNDG